VVAWVSCLGSVPPFSEPILPLAAESDPLGPPTEAGGDPNGGRGVLRGLRRHYQKEIMDEQIPASETKVTEILVKHNGSLRVTNLTVLINSKGDRLETKEVISLCRCGASESKPFCDGTHKRIGFVDEKN
jgi:CDGSH-type Zn-finger protein